MMSPHAKASAIKTLQSAIAELEVMPTTTRCFDCKHFDGGRCNHWNDMVPEEAREEGCEVFLFDPYSPPF